jgi:two-component system, OmpR family, response regulator ResD
MSNASVPVPPAPAPPRRRILVVDDDPTVAEVVAGYLDRAGFAVERVADGPSAVVRAAAVRPDLVVLDLMLPGMDGLEVCRRIRQAGPVPVVMLTALGDEDDRILGLEVGADDYVTKPFSPRELVLRVQSVLRRAGGRTAPGPWLRSGGLALDPAARRALRDGQELALTIREFDLLAFFLRHPGRVMGREELMRRVWGWEFGDLSTVTVHVRRLREKIEDDPARPALISTVWGVGYRFDPPDAGPPPEAAADHEHLPEAGLRGGHPPEGDLNAAHMPEPGTAHGPVAETGPDAGHLLEAPEARADDVRLGPGPGPERGEGGA